jgi:SAM-dependent methyltransferase
MSNTFSEKYFCRICGNTEDNTSYEAREMMYGLREMFSYFQCGNCECLQIVKYPEDMTTYYPCGYYSFSKYDGKKFNGPNGEIKKFQYKNSVLGSKLFKRLFGIKEYEILDGLDVHKNTRILDVGCGNGRNFLYPLAEVGFKNLLGCDPFLPESIRYCNGLTIETSDIFDIEGSWDIITYHHAFEHLPNPKENLKKVYDLLAEDGVCILRIPTVSSYAWEHYRTHWVQLDAPRHFFLHSVESIEILAESMNMKLEKMIYDSNHFQFIGSEKYIKDIPLSVTKKKGLWASLKRAITKSNYQRKAHRLNKSGRGDQAAFFLRKK